MTGSYRTHEIMAILRLGGRRGGEPAEDAAWGALGDAIEGS